MLPIKYGNFLKSHEVEVATYAYNKPNIKTFLIALAIMGCSFSATIGASLTYEQFNRPVQTYDTNFFNQAQKLNNEVAKGIGLLKETRPKDIDVILIIDEFTKNVPKGIDINSLDIKPGKYTLKAATTNVELIDQYTKALNFGKNYTASVSNINTKDKLNEFSIVVTEKQVSKKGGKK